MGASVTPVATGASSVSLFAFSRALFDNTKSGFSLFVYLLLWLKSMSPSRSLVLLIHHFALLFFFELYELAQIRRWSTQGELVSRALVNSGGGEGSGAVSDCSRQRKPIATNSPRPPSTQ